jgi:hypothetical protein
MAVEACFCRKYQIARKQGQRPHRSSG